MGRTPAPRTAVVGAGHRARILDTARGTGNSLTVALAHRLNRGRARPAP
ncbi:hypothetical protein [Streptomyces sp. NPDC090798]